MCFISGADTNLSFIITSEIARVYLNEFKRNYLCKLWTWFMNCKLMMWQKFARNLCINYSCCPYEFILDDHIRNSEGVTRWIQHKITGSLHKRIDKLQTDNAKTVLEFENYKQLFRLPCGACEHNSIHFNTRSQLGRKLHARDKMRTGRKTSFSISLLSSKLTTQFFTELKTYYLSYSIYRGLIILLLFSVQF